jgi:chromosomal replication initiator protein
MGYLLEEVVEKYSGRAQMLRAREFLNVKTDDLVASIVYVVNREFGLDRDRLLSAQRGDFVAARARQVGMFLVQELTALSTPRIAKIFNRSDHTTAIYGCKKIRALMLADAKYSESILQLVEEIRESLREDVA